MTSISDPAAFEQLVERLEALRPDTPRKWGTLTAGEMLCHLGGGFGRMSANDWHRWAYHHTDHHLLQFDL